MDKEQIVELANYLIESNTAGESGWKVTINSMPQNTGVVRWDKKELTLSAYCLKDRGDDDVGMAVRHHVAHVLSGVADHGAAWRAYAVRLEAPVMVRCPIIAGNPYMECVYGAWCCGLWWPTRGGSTQKWCVKCGDNLIYVDLKSMWENGWFVEVSQDGE